MDNRTTHDAHTNARAHISFVCVCVSMRVPDEEEATIPTIQWTKGPFSDNSSRCDEREQRNERKGKVIFKAAFRWVCLQFRRTILCELRRYCYLRRTGDSRCCFNFVTDRLNYYFEQSIARVQNFKFLSFSNYYIESEFLTSNLFLISYLSILTLWINLNIFEYFLRSFEIS